MLDCGMGASSTIFERSYRVYDERDRTFPGLGIGLTIVAECDRRRTLGRQRARALATREARQAERVVHTLHQQSESAAKRVNIYPPGIWSKLIGGVNAPADLPHLLALLPRAAVDR